MNKPAHTPEPWVVADAPFGTAVKSGDMVLAQLCADKDVGSLAERNAQREANARRIVACVNACAGIPTEALESGALTGALEHLTELARILAKDGGGYFTQQALAKLRGEV